MKQTINFEKFRNGTDDLRLYYNYLQGAISNNVFSIYTTTQGIYYNLVNYLKNSKSKEYIETVTDNISSKKDNIVKNKDILKSLKNSYNNELTGKNIYNNPSSYKELPSLISYAALFEFPIDGSSTKKTHVIFDDFIKQIKYTKYDGTEATSYTLKEDSGDASTYYFLRHISSIDLKINKLYSTKPVSLSPNLDAWNILSKGSINIDDETYYFTSSKQVIYDFVYSLLSDKTSSSINLQSNKTQDTLVINFKTSKSIQEIVKDWLVRRLNTIDIENTTKIESKTFKACDGSTVSFAENKMTIFYDSFLNNALTYFKEVCDREVKRIDSEGKQKLSKASAGRGKQLEQLSTELANLRNILTSNKINTIKSSAVSSNLSSIGVKVKKVKSNVKDDYFTIKKFDDGDTFWDSYAYERTYSPYNKTSSYDTYFEDTNTMMSSPLLFREIDIYSNNDINALVEKSIGESPLAKLCIGSYFNFVPDNKIEKQQKSDSTLIAGGHTISSKLINESLVKWTAYFNFVDVRAYIKEYGSTIDKPYDYSNILNFYNELFKKYENKLTEIEEVSISENVKDDKKEKETAKAIENAKSYDTYIASRLINSASEKDFFYINSNNNEKHIPLVPFVDIEFKVPNYESSSESELKHAWISVTALKNETAAGSSENNFVVNEKFKSDNSDMFTMHAGAYFDSMTLEDIGDEKAKKITLTLKSSDDYNLEKIILQSLSMESKSVSVVGDNNKVISTKEIASDINLMEQIAGYKSVNFRVRFGYRDTIMENYKKASISSDSNTSEDFLNRTKKKTAEQAKPVLVYPWTDFKITNLKAEVSNNVNVYTIEGVTVGAYIIDNMCIGGANIEFSHDVTNTDSSKVGTPKNVISKIAKLLITASTIKDENNNEGPKICILGSSKGKILSDISDDKESFVEEYSYTLKNGGVLEPSDLDIEEFFYASENNADTLKAKDFYVTSNTNESIIPIKKLLNTLTKWLPPRYYYICQSGSETCAARLPYTEIAKNAENIFKQPHKYESISYEIIEAMANVSKSSSASSVSNSNTNSSDDIYTNTYFIRFFFNGPRVTENNTSADEYIRVYNYKAHKDSVVTDLQLGMNDSGLQLGNFMSSVTVLGTNAPVIFHYNNDDNKMAQKSKDYESGKMIDLYSKETMPHSSNDDNAFLTMKNLIITNGLSNVISNNNNSDTDIKAIFAQSASAYFSRMANQNYTGTMTIIGDPFYYFDSKLEPGKYEIYLNVNRVENIKSAKNMRSYFSGIYKIVNIQHSLNSSGEFTTTLKLVKYTI